MYFHGRLLNNSKFSPVSLPDYFMMEQWGEKKDGSNSPSSFAVSHAEGATCLRACASKRFSA
jgi:hypothetical protein